MGENRLIREKSPYLLQHARNPVDWYPWGEEAFEKARREDKPVFLSIGYSTCHWCHVMGRESFESRDAARVLNRDYVAVKVDREERPDVDAVYMAVCQAMTGSGGWPLTLLLTPEQKPFWAGTYLPLHNRYGQTGLVELLEKAAEMWKEDREGLEQAGERIAELAAEEGKDSFLAPDIAMLTAGVKRLEQSFDPENGGFGGAPKFPMPHQLLFLLRRRFGEGEMSREMAERTLTQMARGGIFDQIGGGFSRYSTDADWLVPHFEKMLYDNALLAYVYLEACDRGGNPFFLDAALRTLHYLLRDLKGEEGGFCCGQDADSQGEEGDFYLFTQEELLQTLGEKEGERFCRTYGVTGGGNFQKKNILNLLSNPAYAKAWKETGEDLNRLYRYRLSRKSLHRDDKILTAWNALAICALAKAYGTLEDRGEREQGEIFLREAKNAASFLNARLTDSEGKLYLRWRDGEAAYPGQLDDYAFLAWAMLELYRVTGEIGHLEQAQSLAERILKDFPDEDKGGFFLTPDYGEALIARPKETYDGALPSGNAVAAWVFLCLSRLTGELAWRQEADKQLSFLGGKLKGYPEGHCFALMVMDEALSPSRELVCACAEKPSPSLFSLARLHGLSLLVKTPENSARLGLIAPFTQSYPLPERGEVYYLCQNGSCAAPVNTLDKLKKLLKKKGKE